MIYKKISNTSLEVSQLGLGTVKIGRNQGVKYPSAFELPDDKTVIALLNTAAECGINLLDTAPAYGHSEARLGELLPKAQSHPWLICTKAGEIFDAATGKSSYDFSPEFLQKSIEASCQRLGREALDMVLIHSDGDDMAVIEKYGALETLNHLKQAGKIIATGMSTKTLEGGLTALSQSDIAMVTHNLAYQQEAKVIDYAQQNNKSIFIKKAFASGHLALDPEQDFIKQSFDFIFSHAGVTSIIMGTANPLHLKENVAKAGLIGKL